MMYFRFILSIPFVGFFIPIPSEEGGVNDFQFPLLGSLKDAYLESELQLEKMTARQFINVIKMWNELQEGFLKYMLDLIKVFWIEGFRKYTEILSTMSETAEEESKKKKVSPEILQTLPSLITSILTQAFTIIPQLQQNFQQMFTQTLQKQSQQDIKIVDEKK